MVYQAKLITVMHYGRYKILEFIFSYFAADNLHFFKFIEQFVCLYDPFCNSYAVEPGRSVVKHGYVL